MFNSPVLRLGAIAAAAVLSIGATSAAHADETPTTAGPCATQEAQVAKAEAVSPE